MPVIVKANPQPGPGAGGGGGRRGTKYQLILLWGHYGLLASNLKRKVTIKSTYSEYLTLFAMFSNKVLGKRTIVP